MELETILECQNKDDIKNLDISGLTLDELTSMQDQLTHHIRNNKLEVQQKILLKVAEKTFESHISHAKKKDTKTVHDVPAVNESIEAAADTTTNTDSKTDALRPDSSVETIIPVCTTEISPSAVRLTAEEQGILKEYVIKIQKEHFELVADKLGDLSEVTVAKVLRALILMLDTMKERDIIDYMKQAQRSKAKGSKIRPTSVRFTPNELNAVKECKKRILATEQDYALMTLNRLAAVSDITIMRGLVWSLDDTVPEVIIEFAQQAQRSLVGRGFS
ncbi:hypothetical protein AB4254_13595 [Vibrio breoganii]